MALTRVAYDSFADVGNGVSILNRTLQGDLGLRWGEMHTSAGMPTGDGSGNVKGASVAVIENSDGSPYYARKFLLRYKRANQAEISAVYAQVKRHTSLPRVIQIGTLHANSGHGSDYWTMNTATTDIAYNKVGLTFVGWHGFGYDGLGGWYTTQGESDTVYGTGTNHNLDGFPFQMGLCLQGNSTLVSDVELWVDDPAEGDRYVKTFDFFMSSPKVGLTADIEDRVFDGAGVAASYEGEALIWDGTGLGSNPMSGYVTYPSQVGGSNAAAAPKVDATTYWSATDFEFGLMVGNNAGLPGFGVMRTADLPSSFATRDAYQWNLDPRTTAFQNIYKVVNGAATSLESFKPGVTAKGVNFGMRVSEEGTKIEFLRNGILVATHTELENMGPYTPYFYSQNADTTWGTFQIFDTWVAGGGGGGGAASRGLLTPGSFGGRKRYRNRRGSIYGLRK